MKIFEKLPAMGSTMQMVSWEHALGGSDFVHAFCVRYVNHAGEVFYAVCYRGVNNGGGKSLQTIEG